MASYTCVLVAVISVFMFPRLPPSQCSLYQWCEQRCGWFDMFGAWSCAFCTSDDLDVKYFFEPKLFFKVLCTCWFYCISRDHMFWNKNKCSFHKVILFVSFIGVSTLGFREQWAFTIPSIEGVSLCSFSMQNASWFWIVFYLRLQHMIQNCCTFYWSWKGLISVLKL